MQTIIAYIFILLLNDNSWAMHNGTINEMEYCKVLKEMSDKQIAQNPTLIFTKK